jgi:hypothetical protein
MKQCTEYEPFVKKLLAGELALNEKEALLGHSRECKDCRELIALNASLTGCDLEVPGEPDFKDLRLSVLQALPPRESSSLAGAWARLVSSPALGLGIAACLLVAGIAIGYFSQAAKGSVTSNLLAQIRREARENKQLADVEASPYTYSDISFRDIGKSAVALSFDVTTRVDLTAAKDDPLVKETLIQALLNPSPVGTRLKAISFAQNLMGPELKEALLFSMLNDPNVAVRLKAQTILSSQKKDPEIQSAFLKVLRHEESVQMRLAALDYLVDQLKPETLKGVIEELRSEEDAPLRARAAAYVIR